MSTYPAVGNIAALTGEFTTQAGAAADPTTVQVQVRAPNGQVTTATPTRQSAGIYVYLLALTLPGQWLYRFVGTGAVTAQSGDTPLQVAAPSF